MRNNVLYHIMIFFVACCFIFSLPTLSHANKIPEFRTNLGGLPISCSIYSDQATINNVKSSYRLKDVYAVLGKPSSEYKREGITYVNYEGLYFTFAYPLVSHISSFKISLDLLIKTLFAANSRNIKQSE